MMLQGLTIVYEHLVNSNGKFMIGVLHRVGICGSTKTGSDKSNERKTGQEYNAK